MKLLFAIFVIFIHNKIQTLAFLDERISFELPKWFSYFMYAISEIVSRCAVAGFFFMASLFLYRKEFKWSENMKKKD